ncbi:sensor histidine kinase [Paraclostridium bifermentans]|uniref:sensor histidine kinase n=1 Tax=Paraclostridium bifermentans TaxID=1490 RepID=UPI00359C4FB2
MNIGLYLKDKLLEIFILLATILLTFMFMFIIKIEIHSIIFVEMIFILGIFIIAALDFYKRKKFYNEFLDTFSELEEKSYITEVIDKPNFTEGEIFYDALKQESKYINDTICTYNSRFKDYRQYIETWIHEVKTPIATSKLIIENNKNIVTLDIEEEIEKIDNYVEQVLYMSKIESVEKDYHVKKLSLKKLVMNSVKSKSKEIINNGIEPIIGDLDFYILSDSKWIEFIIGQVISNSIKYKSDNSQIEFWAEKAKSKINLYIKDNGVGISAKDLPNIFKKGYTGENGRLYSSSTGIGLYICKKLCEKLEVEIDAISEPNKGTTIKLTFVEAK